MYRLIKCSRCGGLHITSALKRCHHTLCGKNTALARANILYENEDVKKVKEYMFELEYMIMLKKQKAKLINE